MANLDNPSGLQVFGPLLRARLYAVVTSNAVAVYHGSMVETVSTGIASKYGNFTSVIPEETGANYTIVGAVIAIFDHNMKPLKYIPVTTTGDDTVAGYVMVADHPEQEFIIQEDGDGGVCGIADSGQNADCDGEGGNTGTGISTIEMDSSTVAADATLALQLLYPHPDDDSTVANCRWIVKINSHYTRAGIAGV